MNPIGLLLIAGGAFAICGAIFDWDFFFNNYKARPIVALFGRNGARGFYFLLGMVIIVLGALLRREF